MTMEVKKIFLFPFKSLKGVELSECRVDEHGFLNDRVYMLVFKNCAKWNPVTQRSEPSMARINQRIEGDQLILTYTDPYNYRYQTSLPLNLSVWPENLPSIEMTLWDFGMTCLDVGTPEVKQFFVDFLNMTKPGKYNAENLTVVTSKLRRQVPRNELVDSQVPRAITSSFQDIWPGSLMTTASYEDLATHVSMLDEEASIEPDSFRMNLVVETDEPWIEDDWKKLSIGGHLWVVQGPCERCSMPAVDQARGQTRKNRHPLPSLNRFRVLEKGRSPCFGINIINKDWAYSVKVGDKIEVLDG